MKHLKYTLAPPRRDLPITALVSYALHDEKAIERMSQTAQLYHQRLFSDLLAEARNKSGSAQTKEMATMRKQLLTVWHGYSNKGYPELNSNLVMQATKYINQGKVPVDLWLLRRVFTYGQRTVINKRLLGLCYGRGGCAADVTPEMQVQLLIWLEASSTKKMLAAASQLYRILAGME